MCFNSRIVIAAESWFGSTTFGIAQGFRRMGWEVAEVSQEASASTDRTLLTRVIGRLNRPMAVSLYNAQILRAVEGLDAKVLLTVKGNYIKPETLELLRRRGVKTVNYYPDFRFGYASVDQATFPLYSLFVTTKSFQVATLENRLGKAKVRFLHHGYCPDIHCPPENRLLDEKQVPDVLYVGTYTPHKEALFAAVRSALPDLRFRIFGNGWGDARDPVLQPCLARRPLFAMNYAQLSNAARINLAIHMGPADETGWEDLVSTRSFELPACKGFMLHVDNNEIRQLYRANEEIGVFTARDDLCEKISYYLQHDDERKEMTEKAYRRCVPAYSYDSRVREIAAFLDQPGV